VEHLLPDIGFRLLVLIRSVDKAFEELDWMLPSRIRLPVDVVGSPARLPPGGGLNPAAAPVIAGVAAREGQ
jgi:hypothetical protein